MLGAQEELLDDLDTWAGIDRWFAALVARQEARQARGGCPVGSLAGQLAERDPGARELAAGFDRWEGRLRDGLTGLKRRGRLACSCGPPPADDPGRPPALPAYAMLRHVRALALVLIALAAGVAGCGSTDLKVSAAASLKQAMTAYAGQVDDAEVRLSFAGSDALAVQIARGAGPDVFAAANTKLPEELFAEGLVEQPVVFAANRLVLAVPAEGDVRTLEDLARTGVKLAVGQQDVPIGSYTRKVLEQLPAQQAKAILANVRTEEQDVSGITGKLVQGAVDAGFLYVSDVRATDGRLKAIELPAALRPQVAYGVAVVTGTEHPDQAKAFVDGLLDGAGARALADAGFEPPPTR